MEMYEKGFLKGYSRLASIVNSGTVLGVLGREHGHKHECRTASLSKGFRV